MISITYIVAISLLIAGDAYTNHFVGQTMVKTESQSCSFPRLGPYRLHGKESESVKLFYEFQLKFRPGEDQLTVKRRQDGSMIIDGELYMKPSQDLPKAKVESYNELTVDGRFVTINLVKFRFETAVLSCEADNSYRTSFTTVTIHGTHYDFNGSYLKQPKLVDGMYINLVGRLTKYRNDRVVEEADLNFVNWSSE